MVAKIFSTFGLALIFQMVGKWPQCVALVRTPVTRRDANTPMRNVALLRRNAYSNYMHSNQPLSQVRRQNFALAAKSPKEEDDGDFWDRPFFDPDSYDDSDESLGGKLASFVKSDYELAETLYAGILMVVCLVIAQEVLRMQLYGDAYVPFLKGGAGGGGRLF